MLGKKRDSKKISGARRAQEHAAAKPTPGLRAETRARSCRASGYLTDTGHASPGHSTGSGVKAQGVFRKGGGFRGAGLQPWPRQRVIFQRRKS